MATYSFQDVFCTITGPGGVALVGSGGGAAEEGITIERDEDANTMTKGASGTIMHSMHAANSGTVTVRLLKTSPFNAMLMLMYELQKASSVLWGLNFITLTTLRGDFMSMAFCAFKKAPALTWAKEGGVVEWVFDAGLIKGLLGVGMQP